MDKNEQFIWNIREAIRFVKIGSGKKHEGVFAILEPIIVEHIKEFEQDKSPALQLNREEVMKIVDQIFRNLLLAIPACKIREGALNKILSLTPQGFEKVASGEVEVGKFKTCINGLLIGNDNESQFTEIVNKYSGKHIDIYIKESEAKNG